MAKAYLILLMFLYGQAYGQRFVQTVPSISNAVRLNPSSIHTHIHVLGYSSPGDGGGGMFTFTNTVTSTNLGTRLAMSTPGWSIERLYDGPVSTKWFGDTVDDATDDRAAIQAAIDYQGAKETGGQVFLPPGKHIISSSLYLRTKVVLQGDAGTYISFLGTGTSPDDPHFTYGASVLKAAGGTSFDMLVIDGSTLTTNRWSLLNVTLNENSVVDAYYFHGQVRNIVFDGTDMVGLGKSAIYIYKAAGVEIRDCSFRRTSTFGIRSFAANIVHVADIFGDSGVFLDRTADSRIHTTQINGIQGPGLWVTGNKNIFDGTYFFNSRRTNTFNRTTFTVNTTDDTIQWTGHNLLTGQPLMFRANGGTLPSPLSETLLYYAIRVDADNIKVNTQYDQGAVGGAMQGIGIDITTSGSGAFDVNTSPGNVNIAFYKTDSNILANSRVDQAFDEGMCILGGHGNVLVGNAFQENGWQQTGAVSVAQLKLYGNSQSNIITGNRFAKRSSAAVGLVGIEIQNGSTGHRLSGNIFDINTPVSSADGTTRIDGHLDTTNRVFVIEGVNPQLMLRRTGSSDIAFGVSGFMTGSAQDIGVIPYANSSGFAIRAQDAAGVVRTGLGVNRDGNVGILNTNPQFPLDVTGNAQIAGNLTLASANPQLAINRSGSGTISLGISGFMTGSAADLINIPAQNSSGVAFRVQDSAGNVRTAFGADRDGKVGIGTVSPNASAQLDVSSTTRGFLPPRMTKAERNAIGSPANGLIIYQTDNTPGIRFYDDGAWVKPTTAADP